MNPELGYSCVPYYQCSNGSIVTDGAGLIDIRNGFGALNPEASKCPGFLDVCCKVSSHWRTRTQCSSLIGPGPRLRAAPRPRREVRGEVRPPQRGGGRGPGERLQGGRGAVRGGEVLLSEEVVILTEHARSGRGCARC